MYAFLVWGELGLGSDNLVRALQILLNYGEN